MVAPPSDVGRGGDLYLVAVDDVQLKRAGHPSGGRAVAGSNPVSPTTKSLLIGIFRKAGRAANGLWGRQRGDKRKRVLQDESPNFASLEGKDAASADGCEGRNAAVAGGAAEWTGVGRRWSRSGRRQFGGRRGHPCPPGFVYRLLGLVRADRASRRARDSPPAVSAVALRASGQAASAGWREQVSGQQGSGERGR